MMSDHVSKIIQNVTGKLKFWLLFWVFSKIHSIILTTILNYFSFTVVTSVFSPGGNFSASPPQIGQAIITLNTRNKTSISVTLNKIVVLWGVVLLREGWVILKKILKHTPIPKNFMRTTTARKKIYTCLVSQKK